MRTRFRRVITGATTSLRDHRRMPLPSVAITHGRGRVAPMHVPQDELEAQAQRLAAYDARDLTGSVCGDPPVGMSALDEREG